MIVRRGPRKWKGQAEEVAVTKLSVTQSNAAGLTDGGGEPRAKERG